MDVMKAVKARRSIRKYSDRPVSEKDVRSCLEACRLAPSACNSQPWRFMVLQNPEVIRDFGGKVFSGIYRPTSFAVQAPVIIAILSKLDIKANGFGNGIRKVEFHQTDTGIGGEHIVLRAQELGLGTCWIGWFDERAARKFLGVPKDHRIPCLISLGYPELPVPKERPRQSLDELILKWIK